MQGQIISSSLIRNFIKDGNVNRTNIMLGRFYHFNGMPEKGRGLGQKIGVPTVNLKVEQEKMLPPGVHTAMISLKNKIWPSVINIGIRPTFFSEGSTVPEVNILGFSGTWPRENTGVFLCSNIRKEKRFRGIGALKESIAKDIDAAKKYFGLS